MSVLVAMLDALQVIWWGLILSSIYSPDIPTPSLAGLGCVIATLVLLMRRSSSGPLLWHNRQKFESVHGAGLSVMLAFGLLLAAFVAVEPSAEAARHVPFLLTWSVLSTLTAVGLHGGRLFLFNLKMRFLTTQVAVVGPAADAAVITGVLGERCGYRVVAQLDPKATADRCLLERMVSSEQIDLVVLSNVDLSDARELCEMLSDSRTRVCLSSDIASLKALLPNGSWQGQELPLLTVLPNPMNDWQGVVKRLLDMTVALVLLPALAPLLIAVAVAIRIESPGPVLFRQWRFGLGGQPTQVLKFRTMYHAQADRTGEVRTVARDPRVTFVGRFLRRTSIDELPQLLNVLRGDMSLVGPRPHAMHMKVDGDYYFDAVEHYHLRHRVSPGITGWAQVTGSRGEVDTIDKARERLEKDLWYVWNWSLGLDLRILAKTILGGFITIRSD